MALSLSILYVLHTLAAKLPQNTLRGSILPCNISTASLHYDYVLGIMK